jgi:hypothetical protein
MEQNTWNPFPGVTEVVPYWINHGVCYSRAAYTDELAAELVAEHVRASGDTVNGGMYHGAPLGQITHIQAMPERPMTDVYPRRFLSNDALDKMLPAVPETWEVTF